MSRLFCGSKKNTCIVNKRLVIFMFLYRNLFQYAESELEMMNHRLSTKRRSQVICDVSALNQCYLCIVHHADNFCATIIKLVTGPNMTLDESNNLAFNVHNKLNWTLFFLFVLKHFQFWIYITAIKTKMLKLQVIGLFVSNSNGNISMMYLMEHANK